jgi:hypothetical protein
MSTIDDLARAGNDAACDDAVLVSRKYLKELARDAELGRIYRECGEALATIEEAYLKKNPRTAKDVRQSALECLTVIGDRFRGAGMFKFNIGALPWPLYVLMAELGVVQNSAHSPLLTPSGSKDQPKGTPAKNYVKAHLNAAAVEIYSALTSRGGWSNDAAASAIAEIFQERGYKVKSPKSSANRNKSDGIVTSDTVKQWSKLSRRVDGDRNKELVACEISMFRKLINDLWDRKSVLVPLMDFYTSEFSLSTVIGYGLIKGRHKILAAEYKHTDDEL